MKDLHIDRDKRLLSRIRSFSSVPVRVRFRRIARIGTATGSGRFLILRLLLQLAVELQIGSRQITGGTGSEAHPGDILLQ